MCRLELAVFGRVHRRRQHQAAIQAPRHHEGVVREYRPAHSMNKKLEKRRFDGSDRDTDPDCIAGLRLVSVFMPLRVVSVAEY